MLRKLDIASIELSTGWVFAAIKPSELLVLWMVHALE